MLASLPRKFRSPSGALARVHWTDGPWQLAGLGNFQPPNHGSWFTHTFPLLRVQVEGQDPICRVLEGPVETRLIPLDGGKYHNNAEGLPHMAGCEFQGEFPVAHLTFLEEKLPVLVELEAYNPFIPGDPDASDIPPLS